MSIDLAPYVSVQAAIFVRVQVDYYKSSPSATPISTVLRFSDLNRPVTINGESYSGLGRLVSVTGSASELTTSSQTVNISLSGIPNTSIAEIVNSKIKGCPVEIWRVFFDPVTGQQLSIAGNPNGRFFGIINNYSLQEEYDVEARVSSNTMLFTCSSYVDLFDNKVNGRRTNNIDQQRFYPGDVAMERVTNLVGANFNFGAPPA